MKRLILGFLIGCMLLVFAGCGGAPQGASSSSSASSSAPFATIDDAVGCTAPGIHEFAFVTGLRVRVNGTR